MQKLIVLDPIFSSVILFFDKGGWQLVCDRLIVYALVVVWKSSIINVATTFFYIKRVLEDFLFKIIYM